jgi:hypothetical protein
MSEMVVILECPAEQEARILEEIANICGLLGSGCTMTARDDPWERGGERWFARSLEALVATARERGLSDEEILAKVLDVTTALSGGLT